MESPIQITEAAKTEIIDTLKANKIPDTYGLRIGMKGGGCSGTLILGFDTAQEYDIEYAVNGVKVIIDKRHLMYVLGSQVDYEEGDEGSGFTISKTAISH